MQLRNLLLFAIPISLSFTSLAQLDVKKYREEAEIIRKEIWGWQQPEFNVRDIPTQFTGASKVIIARHHDIVSENIAQAKLSGMRHADQHDLILFEVSREVVKINDKSAVEQYSEIEFAQFERERGYVLDNMTKVFVGVRIFKPDGKVTEVKPGEEIVLTRDDAAQRNAKLAIPDLQAGDIIDYFIAKRRVMSEGVGFNIAPFTFFLAEDAPIMHYSIRCKLEKKYAIEYRCYNGAIDFSKSKSVEGENILEIVQKNIPAITGGDLWTASFRQLPVIRMTVLIGYIGKFATRFNLREPGAVYTNQTADEFIQDRKDKIADDKGFYGQLPVDLGALNEYYKKVMKNKDKMNPDSLQREIYYMNRFFQFLEVGSRASRFNFNVRDWDVDADLLNFRFGFILTRSGIENQLVLLTRTSQPDMDKIMSSKDLSYLISTKANGNKFFSFDNMYSLPYEFPYYYENVKDAVSLDIKRPTETNSKNFAEGRINVPATTAGQNARIEKLTLSVEPDGVHLHAVRNTILRGHYKRNVQRKLVIFEDYHNSERKAFGLEPLVDEMANDKKTKKLAEEMRTAFSLIRMKQGEAFTAEAKEWYEQEITDMKNYKVESMGVRHTSPDLMYSSEFKMKGLIRSAGKNLIIDIGKLQGSPLKIEEEQRKRTLDIYMPFARSLQLEIIIQIPDGYTVEGVNELNKKVENETGHFIAEATTDSKTVMIKLKKSYNHAFEPAANWDKLLAFIDAANEWTNAKLLLKKK